MATTTPLGFLQLVSDPQRWQLLGELSQSDRRVSELTERIGKAQNLVSYHLRELRSAGLVSARRSSADGRDTYYRLDHARCAELLAAVGAELHPAMRLAPFSIDAPSRRVRRARPRILFLCTGNSARSQMAEALLEHHSSGAFEARSAGSAPKALHPDAVRVMAGRGIDISGNATKHYDRFARVRFDHVVTLCDKVREVCPEFPGGPVAAHWSMPDPAAESDGYRAFVRCAEEIDTRVRLFIAQLDASHQGSAHAR